jgi:uncharacterized protein YndB with AHSA1/START domain
MKKFSFSLLFVLLFFFNLKSQPVTEKTIDKSISVNCNIDTVWWKWTTHEGLKTFLGPDNKVEMKPGGAYEIYFLPDNPPGQKGGEGNIVLSYLPKTMISFTWNAPPQFPEIRNHEHKTWVVVELNALDESSTEVNLSHLGWLEGEAWDAVYNYFDRAWGVVLSWLAESCK